MKLELFDRAEPFRAISAIVLKSSSNGDVQIEFGPADGAPNLRIVMSQDEAYELGAALSMENATWLTMKSFSAVDRLGFSAPHVRTHSTSATARR